MTVFIYSGNNNVLWTGDISIIINNLITYSYNKYPRTRPLVFHLCKQKWSSRFMKNTAMTFKVNFIQLSLHTPIHLYIRWWRSGQLSMFLCGWIFELNFAIYFFFLPILCLSIFDHLGSWKVIKQSLQVNSLI